MEYIAFSLSAAVLWLTILGFIVLKLRSYKAGQFWTPTKLGLLGVTVSTFLFFLPIHGQILYNGRNLISATIKTVLVSLHQTIRLFVIDTDFDIILDHFGSNNSSPIDGFFMVHGAVLYLLAPALTFGFLLLFFKNFAAHFRVIIHPTADLYIFSELNEKSVALATSIRQKSKRALLIFTDVYEKEEERVSELIEKVKEIKGICFKSDIITLSLPFHSAKSNIYFFAIGEDDAENISQALFIAGEKSPYRYRKNTRLFVFSTSAEGELVISNIQSGLREETEAALTDGTPAPGILVKRVNDLRALINHTLYKQGDRLFENAIDLGNGEKLISVLVLGTGGQGGEMIKALAWYGQMETPDTQYRIRIHAFDKDKRASDKFAALCPELLDDEYNGIYADGQAQYRIDIYDDIDVETASFLNLVREIGQVSYVFVSLGSDELNVKTAVNLRTLFERMHIPKDRVTIQAVVYDSKSKNALANAKNASGDAYGIEFVGDRDSIYSADVIIDSELEKAAIAIHERYMSEEAKEADPHRISFWGYEYNYNSSMASAIHNAVRILKKIPGAGKEEGELTEEERRFIEVLEHRRWNAYMRSEGFIYSGSPDKASRNNLGKMHHNLVCYDDLPEEDKRKDSIVATRKSQ